MVATAVLLLFAATRSRSRSGLILLVHAWAIPELYANRGAKVVKPQGTRRSGPRRRPRSACSAISWATTRASCTRAPGW